MSHEMLCAFLESRRSYAEASDVPVVCEKGVRPLPTGFVVSIADIRGALQKADDWARVSKCGKGKAA